MDTWNTSSMSPQIASKWLDDFDLFSRVYPMDLRPQAHDIIRTWLFSTLVKAHELFDALPFRHAAISGFVVDPDRKKLSKSKENTVNGPLELVKEFGADAVRYWACGGGPGRDITLDRRQMKIGRRLAIKLLNATKFVLSLGEPSFDAKVSEPLDRAMLSTLAVAIDDITDYLESYDYARALQRTELFFWTFTDYYVELVKVRARNGLNGGSRDSAKIALRAALEILLKLFAPFLPFSAEEGWSWWQTGSVHRSSWPSSEQARTMSRDGRPAVLDAAADLLRAIRKEKTAKRVSLGAPIERLTIAARAESLAAVHSVLSDVTDAGRVSELTLVVRDVEGLERSEQSEFWADQREGTS
jgi:valyl-tRNA synthetase